ncbi:hypothetical protein CIB48_g11341 [Xylaria polymorpha]|nr:hypothetical protein CIB48_g11341 [Xylaria polymorpha]
MKFSTIPYADAALVISLLLAPLPVATMFNCDQVVSDGQQFNLKALGGPHSVVTSKVIGDLCAIERLIKPGETVDTIEGVTPLAGELQNHGGAALDPKVSQLSKVDPESGREGLRQTVIDFVCNKDLDGTEGEYDSEDKYVARAEDDKSRDNENGDEGNDNDDNDNDNDNDEDDDAPPKEVQLGLEKNPSLIFDRYGPSDSDTNLDVLHLTWSSKHVCQSKKDDGSGGSGDEDGDVKKPSSHWGAFTWIVILVFLGTAAYLIFGSWLNFTRYGARGWDLLPHGDTIRDIPYLLKDWARRVLNTVQGSGSRGGYSAV